MQFSLHCVSAGDGSESFEQLKGNLAIFAYGFWFNIQNHLRLYNSRFDRPHFTFNSLSDCASAWYDGGFCEQTSVLVRPLPGQTGENRLQWRGELTQTYTQKNRGKMQRVLTCKTTAFTQTLLHCEIKPILKSSINMLI